MLCSSGTSFLLQLGDLPFLQLVLFSSWFLAFPCLDSWLWSDLVAWLPVALLLAGCGAVLLACLCCLLGPSLPLLFCLCLSLRSVASCLSLVPPSCLPGVCCFWGQWGPRLSLNWYNYLCLSLSLSSLAEDCCVMQVKPALVGCLAL